MSGIKKKHLNTLIWIYPKTTIVQIVLLRQKDDWVILSKYIFVYNVMPQANILRQFYIK